MTDPQSLIAQLNLAPHPEGGWYRETWRAAEGADGRAAATAILFLLDAGQGSHWHKVDAAEMWLWHAGAPLLLRTARGDAGPIADVRLGPDILNSQSPQHLIPACHWQAAHADQGWALVSCMVVPGFSFDGFTLAPPGWSPAP